MRVGSFRGRGFDFDLQVATILVCCRDTITVVGHLSRRERRSRSQLESLRGGELLVRHILIAGDLNVLYENLRAFLDVEIDLDLGFAIDGARDDFYFFVAAVAV